MLQCISGCQGREEKRMRFAINYSPQALRLWQEGRIQAELFKYPPWESLRGAMRLGPPHYIHFDNIAGGPQAKRLDFAVIDDWLRRSETSCVNTHLAISARDFAADERVSPGAVIDKAIAFVDQLGQRFGNDRVIVENPPYPILNWDAGLLAEIVDPAVISEIVRRSGCGLLLDLAHAILSCEGTGRADLKAYLNGMPMEALRELHATGILPRKNAHGLREDHFAMTDGDWEAVAWVMERIRAGAWREPEIVAFEYGGVGERFAWRSEADVIAEQTPRLYQLVHSL